MEVRMAKEKPKCKVSECSRPAKKAGFCGWCHKKYEKGVYNINGELTYNEAKKQLKKKQREARRIKKRAEQEWKERKEAIKSRLKRPMLKVLQQEHPETRDSMHCPVLKICICEASCYGRIYIHEKPKECKTCHVHDKRMGFLEEFINTQEAKNGKE